jgi:hypothetical protein
VQVVGVEEENVMGRPGTFDAADTDPPPPTAGAGGTGLDKVKQKKKILDNAENLPREGDHLVSFPDSKSTNNRNSCIVSSVSRLQKVDNTRADKKKIDTISGQGADSWARSGK